MLYINDPSLLFLSLCFPFGCFFLQQTRPTLLGSCNCDELKPIQCHLETKDLWEKFHELGTEMIITKTGRYVFALFSFLFHHFEKDFECNLLLRIIFLLWFKLSVDDCLIQYLKVQNNYDNQKKNQFVAFLRC